MTSRLYPFILSTGFILLLAGSTLAQYPAERQIVCREIAGRYETAPKPIPARTINFLLFDAAGRGCDDLMDRLLEAGASIKARDRAGNTALGVAATAPGI